MQIWCAYCIYAYKVKRAKASEARRSLRDTEQARVAHVQELLAARPMIAGSLLKQGRTCGKPGCRCAGGERHVAAYLSRSIEGRTKLTYVRSGDEVDVAVRAGRYGRFRRARAALMKLAADTARAADALQAALTEPYPREDRRRSRPC